MKSKIYILSLFVFMGVFSYSQLPDSGIIFNGTSNYYEVPDNSSIDLSGSSTIEVWINPCDTVNRMILSKHWCASANGSYFLQILNGRLRWGWVPLGGCTGPNVYLSTLPIIKNNQWQHIAVVHTATSVNFYYNGLPISGSLSTGSYSGIFKNNAEPLRVGVYKNLSGVLGPYYTGRLDELRIWNMARTSAQILANYNDTLVGNETGLQLYHNMESVKGDTVFNRAISTGATNNGLGVSWQPTTILNKSPFPSEFFLGNDTTICGNSTLLLSMPSGYSSYLWDNSSTLNSRNVNTSGTYIGKGFQENCFASDTINVTIVKGIDVLGNDTTLCPGDSVILDASSVTGSYMWNDGSTGSSLKVTSPGMYWVRVGFSGCFFTIL